MVSKSEKKAPEGLREAGTRLWDAVRGKYELRADELVTLESVCRARDRIDAMEEMRAGRVIEHGSTGQVIVHPLIPEIRATEAQIASLLRALKLPDEIESSDVNQQRSAIQSRWASAHGATA